MTRFRAAIVLAALIVAVFTVGRATADDPQRAVRPVVQYVDVERFFSENDTFEQQFLVRCDAGKVVNAIVNHHTPGNARFLSFGPTPRGGWRFEATVVDDGGPSIGVNARIRLVCVS